MDRDLGNSEWHTLFFLVDVNILATRSSDHSPLLITCHNQEEEIMPQRKLFRYEASWAKREEFHDVIKQARGISFPYTSKIEVKIEWIKRCRNTWCFGANQPMETKREPLIKKIKKMEWAREKEI